MFIKTESTPNPNALKFIVSGELMLSDSPLNFDSDSAEPMHPLAATLLTIFGITNVFLQRDFATISKSSDVEWTIIKPQILSCIMSHVMDEDANKVNDTPPHRATNSSNVSNLDLSDPIIKEISDLIDERVRPAVAMDGGDIVFCDYKDGVVFVALHGACSGCPSAQITLKSGVENMLKHYIPSIKAVMAV